MRNKLPPEMLAEVAACVALHADPETCKWFTDGSTAYLNGSARLDEALSLRTSSNARTPLSLWRYSKRDAHIRLALKHCDDAGDFLQRLAVFENSQAWLNHKNSDRPPKNWPPLDQALFSTLSSGISVPRSRRRIEQIIASETSARSCFVDALSLMSSHDKKRKTLPE